ncbi:MAG: DUF6512 family protein [candidate division KSB1 bacterium]|nr:DUF6512 family protein [candidate division KSB1 bacterium]
MRTWTKALVYLGVFAVLHFLFDLTHWPFLAPFCGVNESVFQHLKMAFWAYLVASVVEGVAGKRSVRDKAAFWYSRLASAVVVPWLVLLLWYVAPALVGRIEHMAVELLWATVVTYLSGIMGGMWDKHLERATPALGFRLCVIGLVIVSTVLYVRFTYKLPWLGLFVDPRGI